MPNVLYFNDPAHTLVTPELADGLADGLMLRLWIRRTGDGTRRPIVALAGGGSRIVLGTGERDHVLSFGVEAGGKLREITVPGALPLARWVEVTAVLRPDGGASLAVLDMQLASGPIGSPGSAPRVCTIGGGFVGELAQLRIWRDASARDPALWARYPLGRLTRAGDGPLRAEDAGPGKRHATASRGQATVSHDEPFTADKALALTFTADNAPTHMSPITGLSRQVTMEAWIRPDAVDVARPVVTLGANQHRLVLAVGNEGAVQLALESAGKTIELCAAKGLVEPKRWSHVAATVEWDATGATVAVFHQGQQRAGAKISNVPSGNLLLKIPSGLLIGSIVQSPLVPTCRIGGSAAGSQARFRGSIAEVRIWRTADPARVGAMWLARARGDEDRLAACYRLDAMTRRSLSDCSRERGFAVAPSGVAVTEIAGLPLTSTSKPRAVQVSARGKLVRERIPQPNLAGTPQTKILLPKDPTPLANVFDATITLAARDGSSLAGRAFEVRLDRTMTALVGEAESITCTPWAAGKSHRVEVPASGKVRLRFLAEDLGCPTLRARFVGAPDELWTIVRPDEPMQRRLRTTTGPALARPGGGRKSPMPPNSSDADAEALAVAIRRLAGVFDPATAPVELKPQKRGIFGDLVDLAEEGVDLAEEGVDYLEEGVDYAIDAGEDAGEFIAAGTLDTLKDATRTAKTAGALLGGGVDALGDLTTKASRAAAQYGSAALNVCIKSADRLTIAAIEGSARLVQVLGSSIVDGATKYWRVVVTGVDDAMDAIAAVIERIGAKIRDILEFLAYLFAWDDILAASDRYHALMEQGIVDLGKEVNGLGKYKEQLSSALRTGVEKSVGEKSIGQLCGIDTEAAQPVLDQLDYFTEQFERAMRSAKRVIEGETEALAGATASDAFDRHAAAAEQLGALAPTGAFVSPAALFATPIADLLAGNGALADGSPSLLDALFETLIGGGQKALAAASALVNGRIEVPWLTEMIEKTILGGRKFTLLRVAAVLAAIPAVLTNKIEYEARTRTLARSATQPTTKRAKDDLLWITTGCSMVCTAALLVQTGIEYGERSSSAKQAGKGMWDMTIGFFTGLRGFFMLIRIGKADTMPARQRAFSGLSAGLDLVTGMWMVGAGMRSKNSSAVWWKVDLAAMTLFGLATTATSIAALATGEMKTDRDITSFSLRTAAFIGNALIRISERADDLDTSGKFKLFTGGLAVVVIGIEIGEAVYNNVGEVQSQTG